MCRRCGTQKGNDVSRDRALFSKYERIIRALPGRALEKHDLLIPALRVDSEDELEIYYAPLTYVNEAAQIVLVGITPGFHQMAKAYEVARKLLSEGRSPEEIFREASRNAAFAGSMRDNLVRMLDGLGIPQHLGISSCWALFDTQNRHLVHTTSSIRYPVFRDGENYSGSKPPIARSALLRRYVETRLAAELSRVPEALVVPLGKSVSEALQLLASDGRLDLSRSLVGFLHPSGGNGHRKREYAERREALQAQVSHWFAARRAG